MTNTTPPAESLAPNAYAGSSPYAPAAQAAPAAFNRWRWLLAGVIGILGGYLTISASGGQLLQTLGGYGSLPPEQTVMIIAQAVFALVVTSFAYLVAPGPMPRRVIAIVVFVVLVVGFTAFMVARVFGDLRLGGPVFSFFINPYFAVLFAGALGWLIAVGARTIGFLTLLLTFIVMPLGAFFAINNISSGISQLVQLGLCLVIAVVVLFASRPAVPDAAPAFVAMEEGAEVVEPTGADETAVVVEEPKL